MNLQEQFSNVNLKRKKVPKKDSYQYNCWGFTVTMLGWERRLRWVKYWEMENYLSKKTVKVSKPKVGDIAVFRDDNNELLHTAIISSNPNFRIKVLLHKPGAQELEAITVRKCYQKHPCYNKIKEYRRAI